jgi:hypothetical protein
MTGIETYITKQDPSFLASARRTPYARREQKTQTLTENFFVDINCSGCLRQKKIRKAKEHIAGSLQSGRWFPILF